ncbi:hypothetical protein FA13DRAFT_1744795 [Coprinellus micaceus]|uniref:Nephrocystin 3-like N-terminal domain-containing protein n=1 Tax=Coprinellus micaceus TaxID=71717 RepID=A0A4Y7SBS2_COPMI|nr:hypothetical protein FA13DRAFT_1744795 [Coprinellus micaceus]
MLDNASYLAVGDVTQVNARAYNRSGSSNVNVSFNDGGQYSNNVEIHAGVYQEIRGDDPSLKELYARISVGCMHNSAARVDAPKCHEETRTAVQDDIFSWMSRGAPDEVLWLTGPAGAGKSAIMGTVCDRLKQSGQLVATFFFAEYLGRTSKESFITTLAYQLQRHPHVDESISQAMLTAIRRDPAVFEMSLKEQAEILILQPLRCSRSPTPFSSTLPMAIVIDGVDECGEVLYGTSSGRSRQSDQIEVLSVLLLAISDPSFPFRIIVASRPETRIRAFFTESAASKFTEIFLDDKYSPDDDIRLFLKSKFAEFCRRCGIDPSTWPSEEVIQKLVEDASGQFIYVATVLRFIDTPGTSPHAQLDIILKIKPQDASNPFSALDALYTSILRSSPSPENTVLWLKAVFRLQNLPHPQSGTPSAWTINRLLESHAGQAQALLGGLPSLVHLPEKTMVTMDSQYYGYHLKTLPPNPPSVGWDARYTFYHKSFLDYLGAKSRCGIAFPGVDDNNVTQWIQRRLAKTLKCGSPEVAVHLSLVTVFRRCFLNLLDSSVGLQETNFRVDDDILSGCNPAIWFEAANLARYDLCVERQLYIFVHKNCRSYLPCNPGCKLWRRAISKLPKDRWKRNEGWGSFSLLLDRFNIKRLKDDVEYHSSREPFLFFLFGTSKMEVRQHSS